MPVRAGDIAGIVEKWAPLSLAAAWDNGGFQAGDPGQRVERVLVALDVDSTTVAAAREKGAQMVVAHHPLIFHPLKSLSWDQPEGALVTKIIQAGLAVYCAHTNLDQAPGGTDDLLAGQLELQGVDVLKPAGREDIYKIVVFVPQGYEDAVRDAMTSAGAGWIGNYSHCTFQTTGTGTFKPLAGSNPFIGSQGEMERVAELRLETVVPRGVLSSVLEAMFQAHPYEEVAYDLYRLERGGKKLGFGRIGQINPPLTLSELALRVKEKLGLAHVRVVGNPEQRVLRAAVCGGSGGSFLRDAIKQKAHVFITGDVKYHDAALAMEAGIGIIDAGHWGTEKMLVSALAEYLQEELAARQAGVEVVCHHTRELFQVI